ncbi:hypothetical protein AB0424_28600 [Streptomyces sp. NPDC051180]|uniref:hypothetical protein n=1 Tax=unclassified Streptomyces TaxID=2593676 RepID=UPI00344E9E1B
MTTETLYRPWGTPLPDFWTTEPPPQDVLLGMGSSETVPKAPPAYRERVVRVVRHTASGDPRQLDQAAAEGERLDEEITAEYGEDHPHTVSIRELRGWVCHTAGLHPSAVRWYLHTTRSWARTAGADSVPAEASALRAAGIWQYVTDTAEFAALGAELRPLLAEVLGAHSQVSRYVHRRLAELDTTSWEGKPDDQNG